MRWKNEASSLSVSGHLKLGIDILAASANESMFHKCHPNSRSIMSAVHWIMLETSILCKSLFVIGALPEAIKHCLSDTIFGIPPMRPCHVPRLTPQNSIFNASYLHFRSTLYTATHNSGGKCRLPPPHTTTAFDLFT